MFILKIIYHFNDVTSKYLLSLFVKSSSIVIYALVSNTMLSDSEMKIHHAFINQRRNLYTVKNSRNITWYRRNAYKCNHVVTHDFRSLSVIFRNLYEKNKSESHSLPKLTETSSLKFIWAKGPLFQKCFCKSFKPIVFGSLWFIFLEMVLEDKWKNSSIVGNYEATWNFCNHFCYTRRIFCIFPTVYIYISALCTLYKS